VGVLFGPNSDLVDSVMDSVDRWRDAIRGLECASLPGLVLIVIRFQNKDVFKFILMLGF
jgi:hypothetical protein